MGDPAGRLDPRHKSQHACSRRSLASREPRLILLGFELGCPVRQVIEREFMRTVK
jgi:hypothetical protein